MQWRAQPFFSFFLSYYRLFFLNSQIFLFHFSLLFLMHTSRWFGLLGLFTCYTTMIAWNSTISFNMHLREIYFELTEHAFHLCLCVACSTCEEIFCAWCHLSHEHWRARASSLPLNLSRNPWIVVISGPKKRQNKKYCSIVDVDNGWWRWCCCWWCDLCCFFSVRNFSSLLSLEIFSSLGLFHTCVFSLTSYFIMSTCWCCLIKIVII